MAEWSKAPDSKSGVPVRVPWVRIPLSPKKGNGPKIIANTITNRGISNQTAQAVLFVGEVTERPKVRDWKSRVPHKGTEGSNPSLSEFVEKNKTAGTRRRGAVNPARPGREQR